MSKNTIINLEEQSSNLTLKAHNANLQKKVEILESSVNDYQQQVSFLMQNRESLLQKEQEGRSDALRSDKQAQSELQKYEFLHMQ